MMGRRRFGGRGYGGHGGFGSRRRGEGKWRLWAAGVGLVAIVGVSVWFVRVADGVEPTQTVIRTEVPDAWPK
jgi:hypothetical protein